MTDDIVLFDERTPGWQQAFYAFLAEKERRSGSRLTALASVRIEQAAGLEGVACPQVQHLGTAAAR